MKFLFLIPLFLFSSYLFSEDELLTKMLKDNLSDISNVNKTLLTPLACPNCVNKENVCEQADRLTKELNRVDRKKNFDQWIMLQSQIADLSSSCFDERFAKCYPHLKRSIDLATLKTMFSSIKKQTLFRYPNGGLGMCHYRAENLSYYMANAGFKTKTIRIDHAPTLIAMDRDRSGKLLGSFDDYQGYHTLVQIEVDVDGKKMEYLLDPQYMEEPLLKENYFVQTIGQNCHKLKNENESFLDLTSCYYYEEKQNKSALSKSNLYIRDEADRPFMECGWASGQSAKELNIVYYKDSISRKTDSLIDCTNGQTPEPFIGKKVSKTTRKELILNAYLRYEKKLQELLVDANGQIEMAKASLSMRSDGPDAMDQQEIYKNNMIIKKQIEYSLKQIPAMIERVKKNLK